MARRLPGEIISADSRQVYRHLNAGTAKPERDPAGLAHGVPYGLIDIAEPGESFDAGRFADLAGEIAKDILARGAVPIVAGGTGLYIKALLRGLSPLPRKDAAVRGRLEALAQKKGRRFLHHLLAALDPAAAAKIDPNNLQRVIRALEVMEISRKPISESWNIRPQPQFEALILSIERPPQELRGRIETRCRAMWPEILAEVGRLVPARYNGQEPGFQSLGYPQALAVRRGEISCEEGLAGFIQKSLAYAKRQRTWFRRQEKGVSISGGGPDLMESQALAAAKSFLAAPAALLS